MSGVKIPEPFRGLAGQAKDAGWTIEVTDNTHLRWRSPDGKIVISGSSPSDVRAPAALASELRRAGLAVNGRASTRQAEPEPAPAPPAVQPPDQPVPVLVDTAAQELRELITEARQVMRDLRQERQAARQLLSDDIKDLVTEEVISSLQPLAKDMRDTCQLVVDRLDGDITNHVNEFFRTAKRSLDRVYRVIGEFETAYTEFEAITGAYKNAVMLPPAFQRNGARFAPDRAGAVSYKS